MTAAIAPAAAPEKAPEAAAEAGERQLDLLGVPVTLCSFDRAVERVREAIAARVPQQLVLANAHTLNLVSENPEYLAVLQRAGLVLRDGLGVEMAARWHGLEAQHNFVGTDFVPDVLRSLGPMPVRVFLFGAEPGVAERAAYALERRAPNVRIVGTAPGFGAFARVTQQVRAAQARRPPGGARQSAPGTMDRSSPGRAGRAARHRGRRPVRLSRRSRAARASSGCCACAASGSSGSWWNRGDCGAATSWAIPASCGGWCGRAGGGTGEPDEVGDRCEGRGVTWRRRPHAHGTHGGARLVGRARRSRRDPDRRVRAIRAGGRDRPCARRWIARAIAVAADRGGRPGDARHRWRLRDAVEVQGPSGTGVRVPRAWFDRFFLITVTSVHPDPRWRIGAALQVQAEVLARRNPGLPAAVLLAEAHRLGGADLAVVCGAHRTAGEWWVASPSEVQLEGAVARAAGLAPGNLPALRVIARHESARAVGHVRGVARHGGRAGERDARRPGRDARAGHGRDPPRRRGCRPHLADPAQGAAGPAPQARRPQEGGMSRLRFGVVGCGAIVHAAPAPGAAPLCRARRWWP